MPFLPQRRTANLMWSAVFTVKLELGVSRQRLASLETSEKTGERSSLSSIDFRIFQRMPCTITPTAGRLQEA